MASIVRTGHRGESGQTLILMALALAVMMGFVALTMDVGRAYLERREGQNASDAAALAGVPYLPSDPSTAVAKANEYAVLNGVDPADPDTTVTVTTPYQGDPAKIEVQITRTLDATFAAVVGINDFQITTRAVAAREPGTYAVFQTGPNPAGGDDEEEGDDDENCDGELELEGDGSMFIDGAVHADGEFELEGDGVQITGAVKYFCSFEEDGSGNTFGSGPTQVSAPVPPPLSFQYSDFGPCTFFVNGDLNISADTPQYFVNNDPNTLTLKPGLYCATGDIELDEDDDDGDGDDDGLPSGVITGNVTFVAHGEIEIEMDEDNGGLNLTAYDSSGVLAFTDGCEDDDDGGNDSGDGDGDGPEGEIELEANSVTFSGMLIAACGEVEVEGDTVFSPSTLIIGNEVEIEGDSVSITAGGYDLGGPHLTE